MKHIHHYYAVRRVHHYLCEGWHAVTAQAVLWVVLGAVAAGLVGGLRHEGNVREQQLCGVVINVNVNAKFRASTEHESLRTTLEYLNDPQSKKESGALYKRISDNLPQIKARVREADLAVTATKPPPVCQQYDGRA